MSYHAQVGRYQEADVLSASPGQLVLLVYDHLLSSLHRAAIAVESENVEVRLSALAKSRAAVTELLSTLDREQGGHIASSLASLYTFVLAELVDIGLRPDAKRIRRLIPIVTELRQGFATIIASGDAARAMAAPVARAAS